MSYKSRVSRERNPHTNEDAKEKPFFSKQKATKNPNASNAFFQAKLSINKPYDLYKHGGNPRRDSVVNNRTSISPLQQQSTSTIQRLSTPIDDEKLGTNDARMEKDKEIQEKPLAQTVSGTLQKKCSACEDEEKKSKGTQSSLANKKMNQGITSSDRAELAPPSNAGNCIPGRSESNCVDGVGYMITKIDNDCCTRPCTIEHESIHVKDRDDCCKKYLRATKAPGADMKKIKQMADDWDAVARPVSECKAYTNDLTCGQRLAVEKRCVPGKEPNERLVVVADNFSEGEVSETVSEEDSEVMAQDGSSEATSADPTKEQSGCCKDIASYVEMFKGEARHWCSEAAGRSIPPCPFK